MLDSNHFSDDDLERFALGMVKDERELAILEEHLLACDSCIDRAETTEAYVKTMRTALKDGRARR